MSLSGGACLTVLLNKYGHFYPPGLVIGARAGRMVSDLGLG